jgi:transposase
MQLKTLLNHVHKIKGFVYEAIHLVDGVIEVSVRPRSGTRPICSVCQKPGPHYDTLEVRRFAFVPLWGMAVWLLYAMRRVDCPRCGVKVEQVPWGDGKRPMTRAYAVFLARWARRLSWKETAEIFQTSWEAVYRSVAWVVEYGLKHRDLDGITAIGVDEVQFRRGHDYLTVVYQIDQNCRRLLWVGHHRTVKTLLRFFKDLNPLRTATLAFICSDMWKPYLKVIARKAPQAIHILDRFHIVAKLNKALDEIRAGEARQMAQKGFAVLKRSRWCFLKRPENLTDKQQSKLTDLMRYDLKSVRGYLLKESFQLFWEYSSPYWAGVYLDKWLLRVSRSRLEPIKAVGRTIRSHRELILNWFKARKQFSSGIVEGMNYKIKLTIRKAYGFRELNVAKIALYHALAQLPEPDILHRFC